MNKKVLPKTLVEHSTFKHLRNTSQPAGEFQWRKKGSLRVCLTLVILLIIRRWIKFGRIRRRGKIVRSSRGLVSASTAANDHPPVDTKIHWRKSGLSDATKRTLAVIYKDRNQRWCIVILQLRRFDSAIFDPACYLSQTCKTEGWRRQKSRLTSVKQFAMFPAQYKNVKIWQNFISTLLGFQRFVFLYSNITKHLFNVI